jgi:hypothetical protein
MTAENAASFPPRRPTIRMIRYDTIAKAEEAGVPDKAIPSLIIAEARKVYPEMPEEQIVMELAEDLDQEEFWDDFDAAVALDPDWYVTENRSSRCRDGAFYDTPEKLVAAYRAWRGDEPPGKVEDAIRAYRAWRDGGTGSPVG